MCTSSEIVATTKHIITASPSICVPTVSLIPELWNQVTVWTTGDAGWSPWMRWIHWTSAPTESSQSIASAPMPTYAAREPQRRPNSRITQKVTAGTSGIRNARSRKKPACMCPVSPSALQDVDFVGVGAVQVAVDEQHHREADTHLGRGDREHEQREHLADRIVAERAE